MTQLSPRSTVSSLADLMEGVPALARLEVDVRAELLWWVEARLMTIGAKLRLSPYQPCQQEDPLGLNQNAIDAICRWVLQYPGEHRLGFLVAALAVSYLTNLEMTQLTQTTAARLVADAEDMARTPLSQRHAKPVFRIYPVSEFGAYQDFVHTLKLTGTRDRDVHPLRGTVDDVISQLTDDLRTIAEQGSGFIYYQTHAGRAGPLIMSLLDSHLVLVEDVSYSGSRIARTARKVLDVLDVLYSPFESVLRTKNHQGPKVHIVVIAATEDAADKVRLNPQEAGRHYAHYSSTFGLVFDRGTSAAQGLPAVLQPLPAIAQNVKFYKAMRAAVQFFYEKFFSDYWESETTISINSPHSRSQAQWGYGGRGWCLVPYWNSPNNALPVLWYPHTASSKHGLRALFPRVDSHVTHAEPLLSFEEAVGVIRDDKRKHLSTFVSDLFSALP